MATPCVLLQYGDDPFRHRFEDLEGRAAFSMYVLYPTFVIRRSIGLIMQMDGFSTEVRLQRHPQPLFTLRLGQAGQTPNLVTRITRQAEWSQQHPGIMGPDNSFLYFGPETSIGFIMYGNNRTQIGMNFLLRPGKKEGSVYVSLSLLARFFSTS